MSPNPLAENWLKRFEKCVRDRDFSGARRLFSAKVIGFGSIAPHTHDLDHLEAEQWRQVWPNIENFTFELEELSVFGSEEKGLMALVLPWSSVGIAPDGSRFDRPGRATLLIERGSDGSWYCVHSHYSVLPGPSSGLR
jgi:ketosteroid isomerase-like protein